MNADTLVALQRAASNFDYGVLVTDADGTVIWVSSVLLDLVGYDLDELVGRPLAGLKRGLLGTDGALSRGRSEYIDVFADPVSVWTTVFPIVEAGHVTGRLFIEREASAGSGDDAEHLRESLLSTESLLKESQLLYRELFENSTDLIQSADTTGRLMFVNESWCRRLGYGEREASQMSVRELLHDDAAETVAELFRCELPEPQQPIRFPMLSRAGSTVWVEGYVSYRRVEDRVVGTHAVLRDVTERERIARMKDEFVSMVNHELRTPLTSIAGALRLLQDGTGATLDDQGHKFLDIAVRNVDRLTNLVQEVLDYERLSAGKLEVRREPVALRSFLEELAEDHVGFATARGVILNVDAENDPKIEADPKLLRHVIGNFVGNAIKYAPRDSTVDIGLSGTASSVRVWVHDRGPGVPMSFRPHAFEPFEQGEGSVQGTGLGLSIAQTIAQKLGVPIGFVSITDHGSCFFADVPAVGDTPRVHFDVDSNTTVGEVIEQLGRHRDATVTLRDAPAGFDATVLLDELASCPASGTIVVDCAVEHLPPSGPSLVFERSGPAGQNDQ